MALGLLGTWALPTDHVKGGQHMGSGFVGIQYNVVTIRIGRKKAPDGSGLKYFPIYIVLLYHLGVAKQFFRLRPHHIIIQNSRIPAT